MSILHNRAVYALLCLLTTIMAMMDLARSGHRDSGPWSIGFGIVVLLFVVATFARYRASKR